MTNFYILPFITKKKEDEDTMREVHFIPEEECESSYQEGYEDGVASAFHTLADILTEMVLSAEYEDDDNDEL